MWTTDNRATYERKGNRYPSDLTDEEWALVAPLMPPKRKKRRHPVPETRTLLDAIFYVRTTGCQWRQLPKDFPSSSAVHDYFICWDRDGVLTRVGITADTAEFAVNAIRTWIEKIGRVRYPLMRELTITADCGGSNGARVRLWKVQLQQARRRNRHYDQGPALSAGNLELEQDRAPPVLPHYAERARPTA